jgi:hypothetical protein
METSEKTLEAANELYWGSEKSVNQIADELDLSKGALYGLIRPLPWDGGEDETMAHGGEGSVTLPDFDEPESVPPVPPVVKSVHSRTLAGGAFLGAAAGLALVIWARRR